jgi:putative endonuclease
MNEKQYYIYIMTNISGTTLYVGVTNDLMRRAHEHRQRTQDSFTKKYHLTKLVYFEVYNNPEDAIRREKQLKGGSRMQKIRLIDEFNPEWKDLLEIELDCFGSTSRSSQ